MCRLATVFAAFIAFLGAVALSRSAEEEGQVVTRWMSYVVAPEGVKEVLGYFETYREARECSENWMKSHLTALANEKKVKVRLPPRRPGPSRPPEPTLISPPSRVPFVDAKPMRSEREEKNPDSVAGKTATGKAGDDAITIDFRDDNTVVITDSRGRSSGNWSQTGLTVSIETSDYMYVGRIDGSTFQGQRLSRRPLRGEGARTVQQWRTTLMGQTKQEPSSLAGTKWRSTSRGIPQNRYIFETDGSVTLESDYGERYADRYSRDRLPSWKQTGNSIEITYQGGNTLIATLDGDTLSIRHNANYTETLTRER